MSVLIQFVVGQFDFLEGHHLLHELLSGEGRVGVDIQPAVEEEREVKRLTLIGQ